MRPGHALLMLSKAQSAFSFRLKVSLPPGISQEVLGDTFSLALLLRSFRRARFLIANKALPAPQALTNAARPAKRFLASPSPDHPKPSRPSKLPPHPAKITLRPSWLPSVYALLARPVLSGPLRQRRERRLASSKLHQVRFPDRSSPRPARQPGSAKPAFRHAMPATHQGVRSETPSRKV